jgi:hypothetical protein
LKKWVFGLTARRDQSCQSYGSAGASQRETLLCFDLLRKDYYVREIDFSCFFYFGFEPGR